MTTIKDFIKERLRNKSIEEVSRVYFPQYWVSREAELEEALTKYDQPCMSNFQV